MARVPAPAGSTASSHTMTVHPHEAEAMWGWDGTAQRCPASLLRRTVQGPAGGLVSRLPERLLPLGGQQVEDSCRSPV